MARDFFYLQQVYGTEIAEAIMEQHGGEEPLRIAELEDGTALYRWSDGREVVMTNGDPVFESDTGFDEIRAAFQDE